MSLRDRIRGWLDRFKPQPEPVPPPQPQPPQPPGGDEATLLALHNEARATRRAGPLTAHPRCKAAAQHYADYLATKNVLPADHSGPNGNRPGDRLKAEGYNYSRAGENIARGQKTPEAVFDAWMNSAGHFQNIVDPKLVHFGAGRAVGGDGKSYWCCVFASPLGTLGILQLILVHAPLGLDADSPSHE